MNTLHYSTVVDFARHSHLRPRPMDPFFIQAPELWRHVNLSVIPLNHGTKLGRREKEQGGSR
ncbi:unnamed protein product [Discosporangium mesarthrocarpum]